MFKVNVNDFSPQSIEVRVWCLVTVHVWIGLLSLILYGKVAGKGGLSHYLELQESMQEKKTEDKPLRCLLLSWHRMKPADILA